MNPADPVANELGVPWPEDQNAAFRLLLARESDRHARLVLLDRRLRRTGRLRRCLPSETGFRWLTSLPFLAVLALVLSGAVAVFTSAQGAFSGMMLALTAIAVKFLAVEGLRHLARQLDRQLAALRREMGEELRLERELGRDASAKVGDVGSVPRMRIQRPQDDPEEVRNVITGRGR